MINFSGKNVAVVGFGIEGRDAINYLIAQEAGVTLLDKKQEADFDFSGIDKGKIKIKTGEDYLNDLSDYEFIVRSPGVYRYLPELIEYEKNGGKITSAIKIFFENCPGKIIGVTGTKGKGTTSTLIYNLLKEDGRDAHLSGNIGKPYLELLPILNENSWVVMEMSSFQLIDMDKSPYISVVLNVTSDHMDWHKDLDEYVNAKKNIVRFQNASDYSLINEEYESSKDFAKEAKGKVVFFSKEKLDPRYRENLLLKGEHNLENIAAAVAAAEVLNIDKDAIKKVVSNFKGLEHRLELVGMVSGVTFYNDSFATGPQPTIAAIKSFSEPETLILGGSDKGLEFSELGDVISKTENVANILLIGLIGPKIGDAVKSAGYKGNILDLGSPTMDYIVKKALELTPKGGVVILSPAAASFDMFKNYKDRGNQFRAAVTNLQNDK